MVESVNKYIFPFSTCEEVAPASWVAQPWSAARAKLSLADAYRRSRYGPHL